MSRVRLLLVLAAAAPLSAQTTAAPAAPPHLVIDTVGPDGWRMRLGPTNLGSLLASEKGRELWQPHVLPQLAMLQQVFGDQATADAARERMVGYGGRVRLAVWMREVPDSRDPPVDMALLFEGDGRTDMKALAADMRTLQQREGEWKKVSVGGQEVDTKTVEGASMTGPIASGGGTMMLFAHAGDLDAAARDARAYAGELAARPPAPTTPALRIDLDVANMLAAAWRSRAPGVGDERKAFITAFGLDSLSRAQLTVGTAGPRIQFELTQTFTPAPRGLFAAFFPPATAVPALVRAIPEKTGAARVGHFDFAALFDAVLAIVQAFGDETPDEMRAEMKQELGIDVRDELIAHMTTETLVVGSPLAGLDRPQDFTWAFAVGLRDAAKFGTALDTLLGKAKPFLSREESVTVDGVECKRYGNMLAYDLWFAVGHGTFCMAGGRDAEEHLRTMFTALKTPAPPLAAAPATPAAPKALADVARHLPPGTNGFGSGDLDSLFTLPAQWWLMLLGELLPGGIDVDDDPEARERMRELLQQHQLATLRSATGWADSTWRWRVWW